MKGGREGRRGVRKWRGKEGRRRFIKRRGREGRGSPGGERINGKEGAGFKEKANNIG